MIRRRSRATAAGSPFQIACRVGVQVGEKGGRLELHFICQPAQSRHHPWPSSAAQLNVKGWVANVAAKCTHQGSLSSVADCQQRCCSSVGRQDRRASWDMSVAAGQAWWVHVIRHVESCSEDVHSLRRHEIWWRTMVSVVEVAPSPRWRHPGTNWRRRPDGWLLAFYDSAFLTAPLDRGATDSPTPRWSSTRCTVPRSWATPAARNAPRPTSRGGWAGDA